MTPVIRPQADRAVQDCSTNQQSSFQVLDFVAPSPTPCATAHNPSHPHERPLLEPRKPHATIPKFEYLSLLKKLSPGCTGLKCSDLPFITRRPVHEEWQSPSTQPLRMAAATDKSSECVPLSELKARGKSAFVLCNSTDGHSRCLPDVRLSLGWPGGTRSVH